MNLLVAQQKPDCHHIFSGKIMDAKDKKPISNAAIVSINKTKYQITDKKGGFKFSNLCSEEDSFHISCFGYQDVSYKRSKADENLIIYLSLKITNLNRVNLVAKRDFQLGTKTMSIESLNKKELSKNMTLSLGSTLSKIPGVNSASMGANIQIPIIQGLYGNRILILNNGFKHGFQNWANDHAPEIDISSASRISVIKGASGVRYGPDALGGVIIIEPNPLLLDDDLTLKTSSGFQSNGRGYNQFIEFGKGYKNFSFALGGNYLAVGDRHTPDYSLTNSGKSQLDANAGFHFRYANWDFKTYYSYLTQQLGLLRSSVVESANLLARSIDSDRPLIINPFSYDINQPNQLITHEKLTGEISYWLPNNQALKLKGSYQINKREEYDIRRSIDLPIIDLDLSTYDIQVEWQHPKWLGLDGVFGWQYFAQDNGNNPGTNTTPFIPNYVNERYSLFIIEQYLNGKNIFEAGIRIDNEERIFAGREVSQDIFRSNYNFTNLTGSLGFTHNIDKTSAIKLNLGTAWSVPSVSDLFSYGQHGFRSQFGLLRYSYMPNGEIFTDRVLDINTSSVQPEKSYKLTCQYDFSEGNFNFKINAYANYIDHFTYSHPYGVIGGFRGPMPVFVFNQSNAFFTGTDVSYFHRWPYEVRTILSASFIYSKNISRDEPLINQPPININADISKKIRKFWLFKNSTISIKPSYTFEQFYAPRVISTRDLIGGVVSLSSKDKIFDFKPPPNGYFLLDASWDFNIDNFSGRVEIKNLLNQRYRSYLNQMRYFADELGTNILISLNYNLKIKPNK